MKKVHFSYVPYLSRYPKTACGILGLGLSIESRKKYVTCEKCKSTHVFRMSMSE